MYNCTAFCRRYGAVRRLHGHSILSGGTNFGITQTTQGKIIGIDNTVQLIDGRQAFFVTALLPAKNLPLVPGMVVRAVVSCQSLSMQGHVARFAHSLLLY